MDDKAVQVIQQVYEILSATTGDTATMVRHGARAAQEFLEEHCQQVKSSVTIESMKNVIRNFFGSALKSVEPNTNKVGISVSVVLHLPFEATFQCQYNPVKKKYSTSRTAGEFSSLELAMMTLLHDWINGTRQDIVFDKRNLQRRETFLENLKQLQQIVDSRGKVKDE